MTKMIFNAHCLLSLSPALERQPSHNIQTETGGSTHYTRMKITSTNVTFLCLSSQTCWLIAQPSPRGGRHSVGKVYEEKMKRVVSYISGNFRDISTPNYSFNIFATPVRLSRQLHKTWSCFSYIISHRCSLHAPFFGLLKIFFEPSSHNGEWRQERMSDLKKNLISKIDLKNQVKMTDISQDLDPHLTVI